jgi:KRAB domain-containing zinc finger protein
MEPSEKLFKCNKCDALLAYGEEIDLHMEAHLKACKDYACDKCNKSFIDEKQLIKHEKSHNKPKKIEQCKFCTRIYNFQHLVDKHIIREHLAESGLDVQALPCEQCEERFATEALLNYHKKRSHRRRCRRDSDTAETPCPLCQTVTSSIVEHMKSAHPTSPAYQCRYCPAMFVKIRTRKTHVEKQHRRVVCKYCGRHEPSHDALLKHLPLCAQAPKEHRDAWARKIKDSHTRVYNCSHCDLKFRALNHLRKHEKDVHGTYQMLQCHICLKKMSSSCAFK